MRSRHRRSEGSAAIGWLRRGAALAALGLAGCAPLPLCYEGGWCEERTPDTFDGRFASLWSDGPGTAYLKAREGLLRFDGRRWGPVPGAPARIGGVWGTAQGDVFVNGVGQLFRLDAGRWISQDLSLPPNTFVAGVWSSAADDIYAIVVKAGAALFEPRETSVQHFDGVQWVSVLRSDVPLSRLWGSGRADVFAVGERGTIWHFDGAQWARQQGPRPVDLRAVWGSGPADVYACGTGFIFHYDGSTWRTLFDGQASPHSSTFEVDYRDLSGTPDHDVYVLTTGGVLSLVDSVPHRITPDFTAPGRALPQLGPFAVSPAGDVFVVAYGHESTAGSVLMRLR